MSTTTATAAQVLADIEGRAEGATAGPWEAYRRHDRSTLTGDLLGVCQESAGDIDDSVLEDAGLLTVDAAFIAHARTDVPRMAEALRAVLKALDQLRDDTTYHESMESDPAEIRTRAGWKSVDDYRQDIEAAITAALGCEAGK